MSSLSVDSRQYVTVSATSTHPVLVVAVSGEIDIVTCDVVSQALHAHLDATPLGMVIDLSDVEFLGCAGLAVLIQVYERAAQSRTRFGIVMAGNPAVTRVVQISGLAELLPAYPTIADAVMNVTADMPYGNRPRSVL